MKINENSLIKAQVIKIEFSKSQDSWVLHFLQTVDGGFNHYDTWTNSNVAPELTVGESVVLIPLKGTDGVTRYTPMP